mmetsp:Transcript_55164/g.154840  ORF Transcript_55164/g.154840 Transcript_55164/m.154840 type:complete len:298 (+) Transcript_55164:550-1443(+)
MDFALRETHQKRTDPSLFPDDALVLNLPDGVLRQQVGGLRMRPPRKVPKRSLHRIGSLSFVLRRAGCKRLAAVRAALLRLLLLVPLPLGALLLAVAIPAVAGPPSIPRRPLPPLVVGPPVACVPTLLVILRGVLLTTALVLCRRSGHLVPLLALALALCILRGVPGGGLGRLGHRLGLGLGLRFRRLLPHGGRRGLRLLGHLALRYRLPALQALVCRRRSGDKPHAGEGAEGAHGSSPGESASVLTVAQRRHGGRLERHARRREELGDGREVRVRRAAQLERLGKHSVVVPLLHLRR